MNWIVPFPPGGSNDIFARPIAAFVGQRLGQPVVVENRAGAGGNTGGWLAVATAAPDGYTLLMSSAGILTPPIRSSTPRCRSTWGETAFIPVSNVAEMSMIMVVHPKVEAKTLKDFVALRGRRGAKQAQFRLARHRHHRPSRTRDVHARGPALRSRTCPIAAPRLPCRT